MKKIDEIHCEELLYWLISITKNEALMIRREKQRVTALEDWDAAAASADADMDYQSVIALFARLPETYRAVLEMKFQGISLMKIPPVLHIVAHRSICSMALRLGSIGCVTSCVFYILTS